MKWHTHILIHDDAKMVFKAVTKDPVHDWMTFLQSPRGRRLTVAAFLRSKLA